jgi:hypothetical protein
MIKASRRPVPIRAMLALIAIPSLISAVEAKAADILVVNSSPVLIHPYFKANCWNGIDRPKTDEWVYFGAIGQYSQFTWPAFEALLDPKCKKPFVKFAFTTDGEPPLGEHTQKKRVVKFKPFDAAQNYVVELGVKVVILDVEPDDDD